MTRTLNRLAATLASDGTISNLHAFGPALLTISSLLGDDPARVRAALVQTGMRDDLAQKISSSLPSWF